MGAVVLPPLTGPHWAFACLMAIISEVIRLFTPNPMLLGPQTSPHFLLWGSAPGSQLRLPIIREIPEDQLFLFFPFYSFFPSFIQ